MEVSSALVWTLNFDNKSLSSPSLSTRFTSICSSLMLVDSVTFRGALLKQSEVVRRSIPWSLGGALFNDFLKIVSRGSWSVSTMTLRPYKYVWNLSTPQAMARLSLSILAYLLSESVTRHHIGSNTS